MSIKIDKVTKKFGNFFAVDAASGKQLWNYQTGSAIYAAPITYLVDGKQYVLLGSGTTLTAYALR